jgi:site-specific recombinase XerD
MFDLVPAPSADLAASSTATRIAAAFLAGYSAATRAAYARDLSTWGAFLAGLDVEVLDAKRVHVDAFARAAEEADVAPATLARRLSALAGFYAYAVSELVIDGSPVALVRRPKVADESPTLGLDRGEISALLEASASHPRDHALACLLALNGLRISEALALNIDDFGSERGHRTIRLKRKGGKRQTAALAPRTTDALDLLVAGRREGPVFRTRTGKRMDRQAAWKIVRRLARQAGIDKAISPHSCRHGFVTAALDAGVPLRDVQDAAGHADPRTTRRYDRGRGSLDRHATYAVASFVAAP